MLKLYLRDGQKLHYHEAWVRDGTIIEHWGVVGEQGETAEHKQQSELPEDQDIRRILAEPIASGYVELGNDDRVFMQIVYALNGMGSKTSLQKRHALEDRLNETLGWTGLGHVDGGSIGSGTMEVFCIVVDFEIAKQTIERDLECTEFGDFTRIVEG